MAVSPPFERVLIANRGEIAIRIARTCRAMGIGTIAVYSDADADAPHVRAADSRIRIGPPPARESYLNIEAIVEAARTAGAQAIHPGYGFLSENPAFAEACANARLVFVGPPPSAMRTMGDKIAAKRAVSEAGVPVVPGYLGGEQSLEALTAEAKRIGVPLLVKAAAGGGGKGMRLVTEPASFAEAVATAKREANAAFGDDTVFLERYVTRPRHIEVQVLADQHGACVHLGERECSIQRRHQKVIEETPSPAVSSELRAQLGTAAVRAARAVGYVNAGTIEFVLDEQGRYYFLEMNTRLQVEHPVTELVTGTDLVRAQLLVAAGRPLQFRQEDIAARGHAIEARIYAEDAENDFLPSTGTITHLALPEGPGVRNDAGIEVGSRVTIDYDPMLAKLIVYDRSRDAAIQRLRAALDEYAVGGVITNLPFLKWIAGHEAFARGETTTAFVEEHFKPGVFDRGHGELAMLIAAAAWAQGASWRHSAAHVSVTLAGRRPKTIGVSRSFEPTGWRSVDGKHEAIVVNVGKGVFEARSAGATTRAVTWRDDASVTVAIGGRARTFTPQPPPAPETSAHVAAKDGHAPSGSVSSPMTGTIVKVAIKKGERVRAHQVVVVLEAMKMEHAVAAPYDGTVTSVAAKVGATVPAGAELAQIEPI